jgi:tetratricopeptide (TPR) repeat protein
MQPGRIGITALITLLAAATTTIIPNFPGSLSASPALAQTAANGKAEADRLREQGNEQLDAGQFQAAIQSYQQALAVYREIGDRGGEANALQNLGYAYINLGQYT